MDANWDDLKTVLHLVRGGSLASAAASLELNYTTVARRVARAEEALGQKLFERLSDGYLPTEIGREVADYAERMESEDNRLLRSLAGKDQTLRGTFTLTAPQLLIQSHLAEVIGEFGKQNPEVEIIIRARNEVLNLNRREADMAIRISNSPSETLVGQRLTHQHTAVFGRQDLVDQIEKDPAAEVDWLLFEAFGQPPKSVLAQMPNYRVRATFDDMGAMLGAAQAGMGVLRLPLFLGSATPGLVRLKRLTPQKYFDIWVLTHRDLQTAAKVKAFKALLIPFFKERRKDFVV